MISMKREISTVGHGSKVSDMVPEYVFMQMDQYIRVGGPRVNGAMEARNN